MQPKKIKKAYFTTSWDDGSIYDMKLAELLFKYNIKGTFYIPIKNAERKDILSAKHISELSKEFEIGAHTYSHSVLTSLPNEIAKDEIRKGKEILENILGKNISSFCLPKGEYKRIHLEMVKEIGFLFARTTECLRTHSILNTKKNLMHTTIQLYQHKSLIYFICCIKRINWEGIKHIVKNLKVIENWTLFSESLLNYVELHGGAFHLWGHSWEIEECNLWDNLKEFIKRLYNNTNFIFCSNSELLNAYVNS